MCKKLLFLILIISCAHNFAAAQDDTFGFGDDNASTAAPDTPGGGAAVAGDNSAADGDDDFGFGDTADSGDDSGGDSNPGFSLPFSVDISGEVQTFFTGYMGDFGKAYKVTLGDFLAGKLNFEARSSPADAIVHLNIEPEFDNGTWKNPLNIDEAYGRFYFGPVIFEGGIRKLSWGKADSLGPLDVVNPLDYSDLSKMTGDLNDIKIARPMLHATINIGSFTKVEGVFVPWYSGNKYEMDIDNRWAISQVAGLPSRMAERIVSDSQLRRLAALAGVDLSTRYDDYKNALKLAIANGRLDIYKPEDVNSLKFMQGGVRFTTTLGSSDLGLQYYNGRMFRPAISGVNLESIVPTTPAQLLDANTFVNRVTAYMDYNKFHQIGADYAQVIAGFNVRAEFAGNITDDSSGTDGSVYNPFLAWSLGFDHDLVAGININMQTNQNIRLMHRKVNSDPAKDTEAGTKTTFTRITTVISKKILRDELEMKLTAIWGIEDKDCYLLPGVRWTHESVRAELWAGIFAGNHDGEFGQYHHHYFFKAALAYMF